MKQTAIAGFAILAAGGLAGLVALGAASPALVAFSAAPPAPPLHPPPSAMVERFDRDWDGGTSPDRLFRKDGDWIATGGNLFQTANTTIVPDPAHGGGTLRLLVPGGQTTPPFKAAEIASMPGYGGSGTGGVGYGYYETSLQVTPVAGVCASFFWIEAPGYGPREWDVEFLTDEDWIGSTDRGLVHFTLHPSNRTIIASLGFNPSRAPHRYGFLWTPGNIVFTVDGRKAAQFTGAELQGGPAGGFLMANEWTGKADWGGGPPAVDAASLYSSIRFEAGATVVPAW